ncbi:DegV family protein [Chloroflexota bacterium]
MQKVAVVTDSISCLPRELADQYNITVIPVNLYVGGKLYRDGVDITASEAYELFLHDPESFKTSAPSPGECLQAFRKASEWANNIICITVSKKLSMVYNSSLDAKEIALDELRETQIEVLDSLTATTSEGMVVLAAARAVSAGKALDEVLNTAKEIRDKVDTVVLLDTIRHVYRSGRIPKIASQVGSMLNVRPLLTIHEAVHFIGAVRNREHGIKHILDMVRAKVKDKPVRISVMHAYAPGEAEKLMQQVAREFNCIELWLGEFSPVMGYTCGTGTLGIGFYPEE